MMMMMRRRSMIIRVCRVFANRKREQIKGLRRSRRSKSRRSSYDGCG